ncbi:MAG: monovalent cation/H+ antiporter subunit D family protein, partial [Quisquiliibacterium sp.]
GMSLLDHAPALEVVVPLMAASLIVLVRNLKFAHLIALLASASSFVLAVVLWQKVQHVGVISYAIGNWPPPWGIEYRVDALNAFILCLVSGTALAVLLFSRSSNAHEVPSEQRYLFYCFMCLCLAGLLGMAITGDAFNVFVFLEISALSTYVLIAMGRKRKALVAAYQYLVLGTIGATFIVIGIGLLYLLTGSLNLADMGQRLTQIDAPRPVFAAFAFITAGVFLKLALFPFHQWLPNAYTYAPTTVSSFLAATATKVSIYVLLRFYFTVFDLKAIEAQLPLMLMLGILAVAGMFAGSLTAIFQTDMKRLLAFSSVGQIGYIVLGIALLSDTGLTAALLHLFNHGVTKGASFLLLGLVVARLGDTHLDSMKGMGKTMPWTSLVCGLSLIGVPGTAGFISKLFLIKAALGLGLWWVVALVVMSSLLAVAYIWRFVETAYFQPPSDAHGKNIAIASWDMRLMSALAVAAVIYFGLDTQFTLSSAQAAASVMLGGR